MRVDCASTELRMYVKLDLSHKLCGEYVSCVVQLDIRGALPCGEPDKVTSSRDTHVPRFET